MSLLSVVPLPYRIGAACLVLVGTYGLGRYQGSMARAGEVATAKASLVVTQQDNHVLADELGKTRKTLAENRKAWEDAVKAKERQGLAGLAAYQAEVAARIAATNRDWSAKLKAVQERPPADDCCGEIVNRYVATHGGGGP